ncbi:MAG: hypothetical protein AAGJ40_09375 [Planctomycetota bacterium]
MADNDRDVLFRLGFTDKPGSGEALERLARGVMETQARISKSIEAVGSTAVATLDRIKAAQPESGLDKAVEDAKARQTDLNRIANQTTDQLLDEARRRAAALSQIEASASRTSGGSPAADAALQQSGIERAAAEATQKIIADAERRASEIERIQMESGSRSVEIEQTRLKELKGIYDKISALKQRSNQPRPSTSNDNSSTNSLLKAEQDRIDRTDELLQMERAMRADHERLVEAQTRSAIEQTKKDIETLNRVVSTDETIRLDVDDDAVVEARQRVSGFFAVIEQARQDEANQAEKLAREELKRIQEATKARNAAEKERQRIAKMDERDRVAAVRAAQAATRERERLAKMEQRSAAEVAEAYIAQYEQQTKAAAQARSSVTQGFNEIEQAASKAANGVGLVARASVLIGVASKDQADEALKELAKVQAVIDGVRGGYQVLKGSIDAISGFRKVILGKVAATQADAAASRVAQAGSAKLTAALNIEALAAGRATLAHKILNESRSGIGAARNAARGAIAQGSTATVSNVAGSAASGVTGGLAAKLGLSGLATKVVGLGKAVTGAVAPIAGVAGAALAAAGGLAFAGKGVYEFAKAIRDGGNEVDGYSETLAKAILIDPANWVGRVTGAFDLIGDAAVDEATRRSRMFSEEERIRRQHLGRVAQIEFDAARKRAELTNETQTQLAALDFSLAKSDLDKLDVVAREISRFSDRRAADRDASNDRIAKLANELQDNGFRQQFAIATGNDEILKKAKSDAEGISKQIKDAEQSAEASVRKYSGLIASARRDQLSLSQKILEDQNQGIEAVKEKIRVEREGVLDIIRARREGNLSEVERAKAQFDQLSRSEKSRFRDLVRQVREGRNDFRQRDQDLLSRVDTTRIQEALKRGIDERSRANGFEQIFGNTILADQQRLATDDGAARFLAARQDQEFLTAQEQAKQLKEELERRQRESIETQQQISRATQNQGASPEITAELNIVNQVQIDSDLAENAERLIDILADRLRDELKFTDARLRSMIDEAAKRATEQRNQSLETLKVASRSAGN